MLSLVTPPARQPAARGTNPEQTERHLQQEKGAVVMLGLPSRRRPLQNIPELFLLSSDAGALWFVFSVVVVVTFSLEQLFGAEANRCVQGWECT